MTEQSDVDVRPVCRALLLAVELRDRALAGRSIAVSVYAHDIAALLRLPEAEQENARLAGLVHGVGMLALPAGLLEKPGELTLAERQEFERHVQIGDRTLRRAGCPEIARIVGRQAEHVDGSGFPDGLAGDAIPLLSRVIAVASAYNEMTSDKPYRDAIPHRVARLRLAQLSGTVFDPAVVAALETILANAEEDYRFARSRLFRELDSDGPT